ncbi:MAG TPA: SsrA-binding protein, partial [Tenuifilaceae bacterium]|nr:SsrA-binding protein [Tenuifilaceae bacterium]
MSNEIVVKNKKATFQFEIVEKFTAGIVLKGTEIKSIRMGRASFVDSY